MTTISFKSEEETERLAKLLSPNVDRLGKLLETLPLMENADGDLIETVLERLCSRIQLAASSEPAPWLAPRCRDESVTEAVAFAREDLP